MTDAITQLILAKARSPVLTPRFIMSFVQKITTSKDVFIHEQRKGEYTILDETNPEQHPVRTWHITFTEKGVDTVHLKTSKNKSRRFSKQNMSKGLRAYLMLLGYNTY